MQLILCFIILGSSSRHDTLSPTDTVGSSESPAFLGPPHLLYDQHSSEEELEVINGVSVESEVDSPKRSNSTLIIENRKRSLAQSSDDEVSVALAFRLSVSFVSHPKPTGTKSTGTWTGSGQFSYIAAIGGIKTEPWPYTARNHTFSSKK